MREIKFRAWSNEAGCWCGAFSVHKSGMVSDMIDAKIDNNSGLAISDAHWNENDLILMQYTGFKDKNGVEIYEGDIIKGLHDFGMVFEERMTSVHYDDDFCGYPVFTYWLRKTIEVIGNIYENPELIKETA